MPSLLESLARIYEKLGDASGRQLRFAALREGIEVSAKETDAFVKAQADRQLLAPRPRSDGQTASAGPGVSFQADIIDFKAFGSESTDKVVLAVIDPWDRRVRLEGLPNKKPQTVAGGFTRILQRFPTPKALSTDNGQEFKGPFEKVLQDANIVHKYSRGINSLALLDRAIRGLKKQLSQRLIRQGRGLKWDSMVQTVEDAYNSKLHTSINATPDEAAKDDAAGRIVQFQIQKENAAAYAHNDALNSRQEKTVTEAGAFRHALGKTAFERGDRPKYGEVRAVAKVERGQVTDVQGQTVSIKEVKAVPRDTRDIAPPDMRGRGLRDQKIKADLREFADDLHAALGDRELAVTAASRLMGEAFRKAKPSTLLFTQFLAYYPGLFAVTGEGNKQRVKAR